MIEDTEIGIASSASYLGLVVGCNVNFIEDIGKVSSKLSINIFLPRRRLSCFKSPVLLLLAYYACFYQHLSYAVPI